jgi:hypothetical protein
MMFLSAYHFDGPPVELLSAYRELMKSYPSDGLGLHACLVRDDGITVIDTCPSRTVFEEFHRSNGFRAILAHAGLPIPRSEPLGDVHSAHMGDAVSA